MAFCNNCKNQVPEGTQYCPYCGSTVTSQQQAYAGQQGYAQQQYAQQQYPPQQPQYVAQPPSVTDTGYDQETSYGNFGTTMFVIMCILAAVVLIGGIYMGTKSPFGGGMIMIGALLYSALILLLAWGMKAAIKVMVNISINVHELNMRLK